MNCNKINKCMGNQPCNRHLYFPGQHYSFQGFLHTSPYLWSFSRLFKALKISTLNSRTFHTFPGSVRTLHWRCLLHCGMYSMITCIHWIRFRLKSPTGNWKNWGTRIILFTNYEIRWHLATEKNRFLRNKTVSCKPHELVATTDK